jgi:hypothetical protein
MKQLALCGLIVTGLLMAGCETGRPSEAAPAGPEGRSTAATPATAQPSPQPDPAANGGSTLPASTSYDGGGATVAQSVNPAPFLAGSQAQPAGAAGAPPAPNSLTSRADGTMYGSNDQPAASTSWGTQATNWTGSSAAPAAAKPAAKGKKK